jgi:HAE1 family hydrophobic/amphiphilic exporter-1
MGRAPAATAGGGVIAAAIRRPVAVTMLYLALAALGLVAWFRVPVDLLPNTELPRLRVTARWRGASPETTEALLTSPLEAAVQQVAGVERVGSVSEEQNGAGLATVDVAFARGTRMNFARLELSERLAALEPELPSGAAPPRVEPYVPREFQDRTRPFLSYTLTGPYTAEALRAQVEDELAPELRQLAGVAAVQAQGGRARVLSVELDEARALALGLTPEAVRRRLAGLDLVRDAGTVRAGGRQLRVSLRGAAGPDEVRRAVVLAGGGRVVRLGDLAVVRDGYEPPQSLYRIDGAPAVSFAVVREGGTNAVEVAGRVKARLARLAPGLRRGTRLVPGDDESAAIRRQLAGLRARALAGALVVLVVLYLFLRSLRSAAVVFLSITFAILIALGLVYAAGLTLNLLTLTGLAMGFGLAIDNPVVVLENIYRVARRAPSAGGAALRGARETALAVLAATATSVGVFVPFVYLQGEARLFYVPLALAVGFTSAASVFVSFTLTPALAARVLSARPGRAAGAFRAAPPPRVAARLYGSLLEASLRAPWRTVLAAALLLGASYLPFHAWVATGTLWHDAAAEAPYLVVEVSQPRGERLESTDQVVRRFEAFLAGRPEVGRFTATVYPRAARVRVEIADSLQGGGAAVRLKARLAELATTIGGADVRVSGIGASFAGGGAVPPSYSVQVLGYNYTRVRAIAEDLAARLRRSSRVHDVDTNSAGAWYQGEKTQAVELRIDRARLALHGITARDVVQRVSAAVGLQPVRGTLRSGGEPLELTVQLAGHEEVTAEQLAAIAIPAAGGEEVRVGDVATLATRTTLGRITRENQRYQRTVSYEFRGPARMGRRAHRAALAATRLPPGYELVDSDPWQWSSQERHEVWGVLALSLLLIFMLIAGLFESLRQPFCVLLTVPMALTGVFLLFAAIDASFTREAFIGVIMMSGVVVNSSVLLVHRINQLRRGGGMELPQAIIAGTLQRVRPILMTSSVSVLGLLPLVLSGGGPDANLWNGMGYSLLGGLTASTVLVLTVTPALYLLCERGRPAARARA